MTAVTAATAHDMSSQASTAAEAALRAAEETFKGTLEPKVEAKVEVGSAIDAVLSETEWRGIKDRARVAVKSRLTRWKTDEEAIMIVATGRELGLAPMTALRLMFLVDGKVGLEAQLMHALVLRRVPGARVDFVERSERRCVVEVEKPGHKPARFDFTIEEAEHAGLTKKANWKYRKAMLSNRARAAACREYFPEACAGVYDPEELEHLVDDPAEIRRECAELLADLEAMMPRVPVDEETRAGVLAEARTTRDPSKLRHLVERAEYHLAAAAPAAPAVPAAPTTLTSPDTSTKIDPTVAKAVHEEGGTTGSTADETAGAVATK